MLVLRTSLTVILLCGTCLLLQSCGQRIVKMDSPLLASPVPDPSPAPFSLDNLKATPFLSPTPDPGVAAKLTAIGGPDATMSALGTVFARTPSRPPGTPPPTAPPHTPEPLNRPLGIGSPSLGYRPCPCTFANSWIGRLNDKYILVWAGGWDRQPDHGFLMAETENVADGEPSGWSFYDSPVRAGGLTILSANGLRLTIGAGNGQQFVFDASTFTWANP